MTMDEKWLAVVTNLMNYRMKWAWISSILGWADGNSWTPRNLYMVVVQAVLLLVLDTWEVTPALAGYWGGSTTGWNNVLRVSNLRDYLMEDGGNPLLGE